MGEAFIGVDVGTGSARAGVFDADGRLLASARRPIAIWREPGEIVEHSSPTSGRAACAAVREAVASARTSIPIRSPGSASTPPARWSCSTRRAARCRSGPAAIPNRDTIVWMDHRAIAEADEINAGGHDVLRYVGGAISPEMQSPKLLWLARHAPRHVRARRPFPRSDRFPHLSRDRLARALGLHGDLQMDLSRRMSGAGRAIFSRASASARWAATDFARIGAEVVEPGTRARRAA